ncbi:2355_t:CDS:2 [Entrophospora sp. SA101]|nr:2355_t:CDS:2 [Entrophospora sp. SA101]CAJ0846911.1 20547_t:CDS:2 [Entrophospora sp. SA101]
MSTVISSSPLALRPDSLRFQNFIGEKKNKPSITTTSTTSISSPSSSVSLNMFQEHDEEILNNTPHFEYVSYDKVQDLYEQRKGHFYFIPEGFEPVLVPNDTAAQTVTNLLESTKPVSATPNVSRMLPDTDVRLPSYALPCGVNTNSKKDNANANKANSKPKKTPRPPNAFILYRRAKQPVIVAQNAGISNNDVSKEIGKMWHEESLEVRLKYQKLAEKAKEEHTKRFPEYKYRPRRPQDKKRHLQQPPPPTAHVGKESYKGNQQYQLLSTQAQIFYQNQMNEIPQINAFSAIDNNTDIDLTSNDIDGDNNNNQFTAYLQNNNNLMDFSLFQELQQSHNIDFNNYNLPLAYNYNNNNLFATKPDY